MKDMLGRADALGVDDALKLLIQNLPPHTPKTETVRLEDATGRVLALDVSCPDDLPGFARSTVDGFAIASQDTFGATEASPAYVNVTHDIPMGRAPDFALLCGEAARIATGGMLPDGADAVLMLEHAQQAAQGTIEAQRALAPGENVIQRGEDAHAGDLLMCRGRRLRAHDIAVLAGIGRSGVSVCVRPTVAIISTGDEIVPPGAVLTPATVRDMNSYNLNSLVIEHGAVPLMMGIVPDRYEMLKETIDRAERSASIVLVTGGSSVGARDLSEQVIRESGRILFHGVALRPGKPLIAAVSHGGVPVFGLPGHPRAVTVCFNIFVRPVLNILSGLLFERDGIAGRAGCVRARLMRAVSSTAGRQDEICVALETRDDGLWAMPLVAKSGLMTTLVMAHGTISIPANVLGHGDGEEVDVRLF